ncbi:MAG TPA: GH3 auxin-responsive promoter family protein [Thermoanaerobaculia bacterium]|nr:GH3 auxin-responsive promoter family protein [Thermoanaerobaculia bacterium]
MKSLPWLAANLPGHLRFRRSLGRPEAVQRSLLGSYLEANADTAFGRAHGFASIRTAEEYRERVPLLTGDELAPWVDRIAAGEARVLTRSPVRTLEPTSGSSATPKLIPYTPALQREIRRAVAPWIVDLYAHRPRLALGTAYWSITPLALDEERPAGPVRVGFEEDSEYLGGFWSRLADATLAVPGSVRHLRDPDTFRYATLRHLLLRRDLTVISVWHPSFLLLLLEALSRFWDALIRDVGGSELERLSPDVPTRIWPKLGLISCWGDAHAALSLPELARAFPGVEIQPKGLLATEGFVTIPFGGAWPLAVRSHFFEFIPEEEGDPRFAWELEEGRVYSVVLTTGGGLYRYRLEDRVRVEGFVERTPSLRFLGKGGHVSDLRGEKLHESFVAGALARVFDRTGITPRFALLAPADDGPAGYVLYLETETMPAGLAEDLDRELSANPHYRLSRALGQLAAARCQRVAAGAYSRYLDHCRLRGQRTGDVKPLALSPRGVRDALL